MKTKGAELAADGQGAAQGEVVMSRREKSGVDGGSGELSVGSVPEGRERCEDGTWFGAGKGATARRKPGILGKIARAAEEWREVERQFKEDPAPPLTTLLNLHRVLLFRLATGKKDEGPTLRAVAENLRPLFQWAAIEEQQRSGELAEKKYRDQVKERKAAMARLVAEAKGKRGVDLRMLEALEQQIALF